MEESSQVQTEPPTFSEASALFPPYRRRPLLSHTYHTLIGILSHCPNASPQLQMQVHSSHNESRPVYKENGSIPDVKATSTDSLVPHTNNKDFGNKLVQGTSIGENNKNFGLQEGASSDKHAAVSKLDHINLMPDEKQEIAPRRTSSVADVSMVENQDDDCAIQIAKEEKFANGVVDVQMDELGALEQFGVDHEFSVGDFSEFLDSCFGMDMVVQSSDASEGSQEKGTALESPHKHSEPELQLKEMELEKLINNSGVVEPPSCPNTNDDIEEGEISGDFGVVNASLEALSEDVGSLKEKPAEMVHASQASLDIKEFICDGEDSRDMRYEMADPSLIEIVNRNAESRTTDGQMQECHLKNDVGTGEARTQNAGFIGPCSEKGTPVDKIIQQNAAEYQISDTPEKDEDMNKKKRKKCPLTKERKAKKKKKERIKRAEKNRKLGVKRLKLPPVVKQKKIVYCRHFLQGRCHEGEKCNFSHDTVPLTKSKPCGHFARHSCMKGDDCPFDHELSKYPCKNYTTNGFCSRGSNCLFSHEMPAKQNLSLTPDISKPECTSTQHIVPIKEGTFTASKASKPELKLSPSLNNSNSSKMINNHGLFSQKIDAKSCAAGKSPRQSTEPASRTAGKAPKGVSFLLNSGVSLRESSGSKQGGSSLKPNDGVDVCCKTVNALGSTNKLNEMSDSATPKKPRGINFLSFAQLPSDDSTSKVVSDLFSKRNIETRKPVMEDAGEGKLTSTFLESVGTLNVNGQMNQSAIHLAQDVNENINAAPLTVSQNIGFSPFDKILSHVSKKQGNLRPSEGDAAFSFVKERQGTSNQLHDSTKIPSLSFSGPADQSTSSSFKTSYMPNAPSSVQKAVQSTLAFAAKFEPAIKLGSSLHQGKS